MKRLHDLKARICDFDNLMGAYRDAAREKMYREEVITFTLDLGNNLHKLPSQISTQNTDHYSTQHICRIVHIQI